MTKKYHEWFSKNVFKAALMENERSLKDYEYYLEVMKILGRTDQVLPDRQIVTPTINSTLKFERIPYVSFARTPQKV